MMQKVNIVQKLKKLLKKVHENHQELGVLKKINLNLKLLMMEKVNIQKQYLKIKVKGHQIEINFKKSQ